MLQLPPCPIVGIDYGSKLAGTTVACFVGESGALEFRASAKGRDADKFLEIFLKNFSPQKVFIDAPLSLPGVYRKLEGFSDFFYRQADRELRAMSPMFLGGLTARAMQLQQKLYLNNMQFIETYPAAWVRKCAPDALGYKTENISPEQFLLKNIDNMPFIIRDGSVVNWHHADAAIALICGLRAENQQHIQVGDEREGRIVF